jgi:hypothetical protein
MAARSGKRWKRVLPTATLTAIPFTVFCPTVEAFFPPVVPPPPVVVVVPPVSPPPVVVPPVSPPPFVPPPPPPVVVPPVVPPVSPPPGVPEPATIVTGLIGLAAVAGYKRVMRRKDGETGQSPS